MSEPTYRIETHHCPKWADGPFEWEATAYRITDGDKICERTGRTEAIAVENVTTTLAALARGENPGRVLYADENGTLTDAILRVAP